MTQKIGRYEVLDKIGQGGMGTVYRAFDPLLQRLVAVKIIATVLAPDSEMRERFFREARAAGQLTHKNIIVIYDLGEEDGHPYLAMEYLAGSSLDKRLDQSGRLPLDEALRYTVQTCQGLEFAHASGVIHRDVKPANLFVTNTGELKVLDFGLARLVASELTRSDAVMGTANYMAPEQVRGERIDHRADVFAVGAVLFELVTGRKAFEGDSFVATLFKIAQEPAPRPTTFEPSVPRDLETILDRALAKRREERYQTIREMLHDLMACSASGDRRTAVPSFDTALPTILPTMSPDGGMAVAVAPPRVSSPPSMPWSPRRVRTTGLIGVILGASVIGALLEVRESGEPGQRAASVAPAGLAPSAQNVPASPARPPALPVSAQPAPPARPPSVPAPNAAAQTRAQVAGGLQNQAPAPNAPGPIDATGKERADLANARLTGAKPAAEGDIARVEQPALVPGPARAEQPGAPEQAPRTLEPTLAQQSRPPEPPRASEQTSTASAASDQQAIRNIVMEYVSALQARNLAALARIWPSLGGTQERALRAEFENARSLQVELSDQRIDVAGETATMSARRQYVIVTADGARLSTTNRTTIALHHVGNSWVITNITYQ